MVLELKNDALKLPVIEAEIPKDLAHNKKGIASSEAREKLKNISPRSIGQAGRISGVSPSDINVLLVYIGRWKN